MRIAIVTCMRRQVGGVEIYLANLIPELYRLSYELAFWHEVDGPANRELIQLPEGVPAWCVASLGTEAALTGLRQWHPDLIYAHGLTNPDLEMQIVPIAPVIFFAHCYHGTCISGNKMWRWPVASPCRRSFSCPCLLHYYPHRCGGLNPFTMVREYRRQQKRVRLCKLYQAILTHSDWMRQRYIQQGIEPNRVHKVTWYVPDNQKKSVKQPSTDKELWRLLFVGRMEFSKGGDYLLRALSSLVKATEKRIAITFVGDGRLRSRWERQANQLQHKHKRLQLQFTGWLSQNEIQKYMEQSDLLVVPSLWPEPFGQVGVESGLCGLPAVAFDVGGISEWLHHGVNGYLAPGNPPTVKGLAQAIVRCMENLTALSTGAWKVAKTYSSEAHIWCLTKAFKSIVNE